MRSLAEAHVELRVRKKSAEYRLGFEDLEVIRTEADMSTGRFSRPDRHARADLAALAVPGPTRPIRGPGLRR